MQVHSEVQQLFNSRYHIKQCVLPSNAFLSVILCKSECIPTRGVFVTSFVSFTTREWVEYARVCDVPGPPPRLPPRHS